MRKKGIRSEASNSRETLGAMVEALKTDPDADLEDVYWSDRKH